jgi:hypothetical protein
VALTTTALFLAGLAQAGERVRGPVVARTADLQAPTVARAESPVPSSFLRAHLLPRLNSQFDAMAHYQALPGSGEALSDHPLFDRVTDHARRRAERGTRKALEAYLLEITPAGRFLERLETRAPFTGGQRQEGGVRVGVGIAHCAPFVELRGRAGTGTFRTQLGLLGRVGLEYSRGRLARARLYGGYDARDGEFDLGCRLRF